MSPEDYKIYNNFFDLFTTDGWKQMMESVKADAEALADVRHINSPEDMWKNKGKVEILDNMITFQEFIEQSYEEHLRQDKENPDEDL